MGSVTIKWWWVLFCALLAIEAGIGGPVAGIAFATGSLLYSLKE